MWCWWSFSWLCSWTRTRTKLSPTIPPGKHPASNLSPFLCCRRPDCPPQCALLRTICMRIGDGEVVPGSHCHNYSAIEILLFWLFHSKIISTLNLGREEPVSCSGIQLTRVWRAFSQGSKNTIEQKYHWARPHRSLWFPMAAPVTHFETMSFRTMRISRTEFVGDKRAQKWPVPHLPMQPDNIHTTANCSNHISRVESESESIPLTPELNSRGMWFISSRECHL